MNSAPISLDRLPLDPAERLSRWYWPTFVLVVVILCVPIVATTYHPLVDYPNHLARAYILHDYDRLEIFQRHYVVSRQIVPNLAIDLIVPTLLGLMTWKSASILFLCLVVVVFVLGCHYLGAAIHRRPTWLAIPSMFFVYNSAFLYGYVNYVFGLGCFAIALGYWLPRRHRWTAGRLALAAFLTSCAYVSHLAAFTFLVLAFGSIRAWDVWKRDEPLGPVATSLLPLAPGLLLYSSQIARQGGAGGIQWNTLSGKLVAMLPLVLTYDRRFDLVYVLILVGLCGVLLRMQRREGPVAVIWPTFLAGMVLFAFLIVSPKGMLTGSGADARFFVPAALLVLLSVRLRLPTRVAMALFVAALALFSARVGAIWHTWQDLDAQIAEQVSLFSVLPIGARVYPAFPSPDVVSLSKTERSLEHAISLATITRRAVVLSQFAIPGQQPVLFRTAPRFVLIHDTSDDWTASLGDAEYVWSYSVPPSAWETLTERCVPIASRGGFTIWWVKR